LKTEGIFAVNGRLTSSGRSFANGSGGCITRPLENNLHSYLLSFMLIFVFVNVNLNYFQGADMQETCTRYFKINRRDLVYLKFILEAYEGLTTLSTADRDEGIVRLNMPRGFSEDVGALVDVLRNEIAMIEVDPPHSPAVAICSPSGQEDVRHA
jgi:hypothetical protein